MEIYVDIEEDLLCELDQAARILNITRNMAIRDAVTAWLSQARRDAAIRELFEAEFESSGADQSCQRSPPSPGS